MANNYSPFYGFTFEAPFSGLLLSFSRDLFNLRSSVAKRFNVDINTEASIAHLHLVRRKIIPIASLKYLSVYYAYSYSLGGASRFSIAETTYERLGRSTLSELKGENNMLQKSSLTQHSVLLSFSDYVSLQYSYGFMNIERAWMFWHELVSDITQVAIIIGMSAVPAILPEEMRISCLISIFQILRIVSPLLRHKGGAVILIGTMRFLFNLWWDNFNYKHNNWPFDDEPPLRYRKHTLTLSYRF
ncbi:TPA: hypothetical protein EYP70_00930 [Candidatus Bathyarchaeota archaeon]|nr:hypothetical protein [Candidatus Bathyarchaeota archaeon]